MGKCEGGMGLGPLYVIPTNIRIVNGLGLPIVRPCIAGWDQKYQ